MAIRIPLITDYDGRGVKRAEKAFADLGTQTRKVGASIRSALLPAAAAAGALAVAAVSSVKAAIQDEQAQALLARQLRTTTKATDDQIAATERYIDTLARASGVADDELRPALASLVRATRNTQKAQRLLRVALDVSRGSGKSLSAVVQGISRAYGGNLKSLARLDPSLKNFITKTSTADQVVGRLASNFRGAAATSAQTFQGRLDRLKIASDELREQVGVALLPVFEKLASFMNDKVVPYVQKLVDAFGEQGLIGVIKVVHQDLKDLRENQMSPFMRGVVDLTQAFAVLYGSVKVIMFFSSVGKAIGAAQVAMTSLGGAFLLFAGATATTFLTAVGLILATVTLLIGALKDPIFRQAFGQVLLNSLKLIGNAFILVYNQIAKIFNVMARQANRLLPGNPFGQFQTFNLMEFDFSEPAQTNPNTRTTGSTTGGVVINVNGGDPQAVVDSITRWYRQNGPNAPWMS